MIVDDAIKVVYKKLNAAVSVPVYQYARPSDSSDEAYYVINALPIGNGLLQKCVINVNAYCQDVSPGVPDSLQLTKMSNLVITKLDATSSEAGGIFIFFQQQNIFQGEELQNHYSNMRFDIRLLNN